MNKELKTKWIKALRSGRYKQCLGRLESDGAYCSLGVLCKVARKKIVELSDFNQTSYDWMDKIMPYKTRCKIAKLNDTKKCSFAKIADYIEQKL